MAVSGYLHEVFVSFQGEGLHVGRRQVFVRLGGCSLRCRYCDTPEALVTVDSVAVEQPGGGSLTFANPVAAQEVAAWIATLDPAAQTAVALTGGEPLEQIEFLDAIMTALAPRPLYLETAGVHAEAMARVRSKVATVALDLKLDSVAEEGPRAAEHAAFLTASRGPERMAKMIVNEAADPAEVAELACVLAAEDRRIPLILQPETPAGGRAPSLSLALLNRLYAAAAEHLDDVRVIPQTHKFLELP